MRHKKSERLRKSCIPSPRFSEAEYKWLSAMAKTKQWTTSHAARFLLETMIATFPKDPSFHEEHVRRLVADPAFYTLYNVYIDSATSDAVSKLCADLGITFSSAVRLAIDVMEIKGNPLYADAYAHADPAFAKRETIRRREEQRELERARKRRN